MYVAKQQEERLVFSVVQTDNIEMRIRAMLNIQLWTPEITKDGH